MALIEREKLIQAILDGPFWHKAVIYDKAGKMMADNTDAMNRGRVVTIIDSQPEWEHLTCIKCKHCRELGDYALCMKIGSPMYGKELDDVYHWYCKDAERKDGNV